MDHHIRAITHENGCPYELEVTIAYFSTSHDHIHHVQVLWSTLRTHMNTVFQAVLIAHKSAATRGKKTENRFWKRVVLSETEFAWLRSDIAWAFLQ